MKITFSYQPQNMPPPFAYAAVMQIDRKEKNLHVKFQLEYLDRETLSDDELRAEGFSKQDDFSCEDKISLSWSQDIDSLVQGPFGNEPDEDTYLYIEIDGKQKGFPIDIERANLVFHEVMQAVLEACEIETPLELLLNTKNTIQKVTWWFSKRIIEMNGVKSTNWIEGRKLMKTIYSLDYEGLKPMKKTKTNTLSLEHGSWIEILNEEFWKSVEDSLKKISS